MLGQIWNRLRSVLKAVGDFQARLILAVVYFVIVVPTGFVMKFFSDPLRLAGGPAWSKKHLPEQSIEAARQQS